jgi:hypothetical protein
MAVDQQAAECTGSGRTTADLPLGDKTTFRLAAYGAVLVVVLFAGYGLGRLNNGTAPPVAVGDMMAGAADSATTGATSSDTTGSGVTTTGPGGGGTGSTGSMPGMAMDEGQAHSTVAQAAAAMPAGAMVGGLSLSDGGLTLVPLTTTFLAGRRQRLSFRVTGGGGVPVTTFAVVHDKLLHLVVVRRDLTGYQHLHPTMAPDGTWSIGLTLAHPGMYRMIADFTAVVGGRPVAAALGSDLTVAGNYEPVSLPAPARALHTVGYAVSCEGTPNTDSVQPILVGVNGPDRRPAALQRYLGPFGHLVMIRQGDLGYVHVHPEAQLVDGKVKFWLTAPSQGAYRMFFDFRVAGRVHTAAWTVIVN